MNPGGAAFGATPLAHETLALRLAKLPPEKRALLERRLIDRRAVEDPAPPITRRTGTGPCPLSYAQELMWLVHQLSPGTFVYNSSGVRRLRGVLDVPVLQRALDAVVTRHDSLRTNFRLVAGTPMQVVGGAQTIPLPLVDLRGLTHTHQDEQVREIVQGEVRHPFDLEREPLFRAKLLQLAERDHVLVTVANHIVWDGWSKGVLFRELGTLYTALLAGLPAQLPDLPIGYADYATWQRQWLDGDALEARLAYWRQRLAGCDAVLDLPTDHPRPAALSYAGSRQSLWMPNRVLEALKALAQARGATLFMILVAAVQTLLHRYCAQDDIAIGTPIASRNRTELEGLIGYFTNTVVIRTDLSGDPTFTELLERVREVTLEALAHQDAPFERVVQDLRPGRSLSHSPIFQVLLTFQNAAPETLALPGLAMELIRTDPGTSKFDLSFGIGEHEGQLHTSLEYSSDLFEAETITRMRGHFGTLLEAIVTDPDRRLSTLPLLTATERRLLVAGRNRTAVERPGERGLHELFEGQVRRTPDALAVTQDGRSLSFAELDAQANRLAHHLIARGVGPEVIVGLCVDRSLPMAVGILGILKAGGACLPLDPAYPTGRLAAMLDGVGILLAQDDLVARLPATNAAIVRLHGDAGEIAGQSPERPAGAVADDQLAYVTFTSGSTGRPRGVLLTHAGLTNHALAAVELYDLRPGDRVLQLSSISFDISIEELFPSWVAGATVVLHSSLAPLGGRGFAAWVGEQSLTVLDLPTAFWHNWLRDLLGGGQSLPACLRLVIVGGEKALAGAYTDWRKIAGDEVRWINTYGPTEASVIASAYEPPPAEPVRDPIPIGRPIANTQLYVLDASGEPAPIGVPGELYIGGMGVARGYLGGAELTTERFVADHLGGAPGARLYRTGDLCRCLPDGNLEFLRRIDDQVKIRGFRVEPGEIEAALRCDPAVQDAVVVAHEDEAGERRLVGYVVAEPGAVPSEIGLRRLLRQRLPDYMIPAAIVTLEALPLTANGKVDRGVLPRPAIVTRSAEEDFVAPRDAEEQLVAAIWAQILKLDRVGVHDDFFGLGGHSLLATQVMARLLGASGLDLPLRAIFEAPTVAGLAEAMRTHSTSDAPESAPPLVRVARDRRPLPPSPAGARGRR